MRSGLAWATGWLVGSAMVLAEAPPGPFSLQPLVLQEPRESVYAPPTPPKDSEGVNEGAVHTQLEVRYVTDYMFRGIERFEFDPEFPRSPDAPPPAVTQPKEDYANIQFDGTLHFDLGKLPSPFVRLFVNAAEDVNDDDSQFQEIRPTVGLDWNLRPLLLSFGHTSYIFPETDFDANGVPESAEDYVKLTNDDSYFFRSEKPVFSPYIFVAYDYDEFEGTYIEAGGSHTFTFEDTGLSLRFDGHVAYASGLSELFGANSGFQHYQLGLIGEYSLNQLFNVSTRYGDWSIRGYLYYTGEIDKDLRADEQVWGGAGIGFRY